MFEVLRELCTLDGVSGCEDEVREYIKNKVSPFADEIREDSMGNLIVFKKGKKPLSKRIMLSAHMDEVGFIIKKIGDDGFLKFGAVGGIDRRVCIGRRVRIGENKIPGLIGIKAVHMTTAEERKNAPKMEDLYIDIGAANGEEAKKVVAVGDFAAFDTEPFDLGEGLFSAKAIDDRLGCAVLLSLIKEELPCDLYFAFTVQEEVGLRGAQVVAYTVAPDLALVIEGTTAADLPEMKEHKKVCVLKQGAVVPFMDGATIYPKELYDEMLKIARTGQIKCQTKQFLSGGTDAGKIHLSREGIPTLAIAAPVRYLHSPLGVAAKSDMLDVLNLTRLFLQKRAEQLS